MTFCKAQTMKNLQKLVKFYLSTGLSYSEIADKLGVSVWTVTKAAKDLGIQSYKSTKAALYHTEQYVAFRKAILSRDGHKCTTCGSTGTRYNPLQVEHIKPKALYPELIFEPTNAKTLCLKCHKKTSTFGRRKLKKYALAVKNSNSNKNDK